MAQGRTYIFGWVAVACIAAAAVLGYFLLHLKGLTWGAISIWGFFMIVAAFTGNWDRFLRFQDKGLTFFEEWTLYFAVMVGLVSLFINVILRYVFSYSMAWSEELIRELIILTTFVGLAPAIKNRSMITIDALVQIVPRLRAPLTYFSHFSVLLFSAIITKFGIDMALMQERTSQETIILEIPLVILYLILPLMGVTMGVRTVQVLWWDFQEGRSKNEAAG